ncbi:MAG TPA: hypothetical protein VJ867_17200 [Gemmatimonadaceae bacterium]|nr:hypothetical protein [Gemmatimonadaceae bacterium]
MESTPNLAPPPPAPTKKTPTPSHATAISDDRASSKFSQMLAVVEMHRTRVRAALGAALLARVLFEFQFVSLLRDSRNLMVQMPYIGFAMLSYLLVLMWLSARTRDRFGFGMALGIGVLEATYLFALAAMQRPFTFAGIWPPVLVALAHLPMAYFAFQSSTAYPPLDSKRPWIVGFVTALVFLAIPWIAPTLVSSLG